MSKIDHKEFEREVILRQITIDDFDAIVAMQARCFPGMQPWERAHLESQIAIFPEGQLCIEIDGELSASSSSLRIDYDPRLEWHNADVISDYGYIRNHNPYGDTLYGIEIMVDPESQGMKLSRRLYDARKEFCRSKNISRMIVGGRIPGYYKVADSMSPHEYTDAVVEKSIHDPVLTAQLANGFALQGLIPNYMLEDEASCGYATYLEWRNLAYRPGAKRRYNSPTEPVRICVVQYEMRTIKGFEDFATQCEFFVDVASDYKSDFILFPELFTTQLLSCVKAERPGLAARTLAGFTPQYLDLFSKLSIKYDVNVVGGSHFVVENDLLYNVAYLFGRDGSIGKQYKLHVTPNERRWWGVSPGNQLEVFDTDCGKICIQICYDVEFPELSRLAAHKGAQITFVPFNTDTRQGYLRVRHCALARCVENHMFVAIAGCAGNLPFVENADIHYAQSGIFTPSDAEFARDAVAAETQPNTETVIIHDVDIEQVRRHRDQGTVQNWKDRRTDLYRVHFSENGAVTKI